MFLRLIRDCILKSVFDKSVYSPKEFFLITRFNFVFYPKPIGKKVLKKKSTAVVKKRCLFWERLFPKETNSFVTIIDLKSFILNDPFLVANDDNVVRACIIFVLCRWFWGKKQMILYNKTSFFS
uniref:Uncharacterized protein n=1 Tax=Lactuca sativa TaxID=4236 RepID=A0A9R1VQ48_LACSA|nr:hypothetical protein LSAT_V11C400195800 [Lactuca sativa]